jgi:hypothetical protein
LGADSAAPASVAVWPTPRSQAGVTGHCSCRRSLRRMAYTLKSALTGHSRRLGQRRVYASTIQNCKHCRHKRRQQACDHRGLARPHWALSFHPPMQPKALLLHPRALRHCVLEVLEAPVRWVVAGAVWFRGGGFYMRRLPARANRGVAPARVGNRAAASCAACPPCTSKLEDRDAN